MNLLNQIVSSQRLARWEIRAIDVGLFVCFFLAFAYVASGLLKLLYTSLSGSELEMESLWFLIVSGFGTQLGCVMAWIAFRVFAPFENRNLPDSFGRSFLWGILGFVIAYLAIIPISLVWQAGLEALNIEYELQLPVQLVKEGGAPLEMTLTALLIVVGVPIGEELLYRGFLYRYLHRRLPDIWAISLSSAFFALMHFNLYSFVPLFILGIALSVVYRATGNIVSCIAMHAGFNGINLLLMLTASPVQP